MPMPMSRVILSALIAREGVFRAMLPSFATTASRGISLLMTFAVEIVSIIPMYLLSNVITVLKVVIIVIILPSAISASPIISSLTITAVALVSSM